MGKGRQRSPFDRLCCGISAGLLSVFLAVTASLDLAMAASDNAPDTAAQNSSGQSAVIVVIPEGMDPAERQQIVDEVLAAQASGGAPTDDQSAPSFFDSLGAGLDQVQVTLGEGFTSIGQIPIVFTTVVRAAGQDGTLAAGMKGLLFGLIIIFGGALLIELVLRRLFWRAPPPPNLPEGHNFTERMQASCAWLLREFVALALFCTAATGIFFALLNTQAEAQLVATTYIGAVAIIRFIGLISNFVLAPNVSERRMVPLSDEDARTVHFSIVGLVAFIALMFSTQPLALTLGAPDSAILAYALVFGTMTVVLEIIIVLRIRQPIAELILKGGMPGETRSRLRVLIAQNWHTYVIVFFIAIFLTALYNRSVEGEGSRAIATLSTMALVVILPLLIRATQQLLSEYFERSRERRVVNASTLRQNCEVAMLRVIPILYVLLGITLIGMLWNVNVFSLSKTSIGQQVFDAVLDIGVVLILAYFLWEIVKSTIDQRIREEDPEIEGGEAEEGGGNAASRLSTLLPLIRTTFFIVLLTVVIFVVLSELGFNIGPLIAGAGVVGLAIGFGAQALVTDIISGMFFLIDDAFRRGEYIDVGSAKGTVEKISLRSLQLRHQNGPVHTVPFGQIATLSNFSRDWAIIKFEVRVPFETDINKVRRLVKNIGIEMMEDELLGPMILAPLKSQGVNRMDDSALIVRCKFTAVPGKQFLVRREAFTRIQLAFAEHGIKFAPRRVVVDAPTPELASAATAAMAEQEEQTAPKPASGPDG